MPPIPPQGYPQTWAQEVGRWSPAAQSAYWKAYTSGDMAAAQRIRDVARGTPAPTGWRRPSPSLNPPNLGRWMVSDVPTGLSNFMGYWSPRQIAAYYKWDPSQLYQAKGIKQMANAWRLGMSANPQPGWWNLYTQGYQRAHGIQPRPGWTEY